MLAGLVLCLLVVVCAAVAGPAHFTGPRWLVHLGSGHARPLRVAPPHGGRAMHGGGGLPGWLLWAVLAVIAAGLLAFVVRLLWRLSLRRPSRVASPPAQPIPATAVASPAPEPEPDVPAVRRGIEAALEALDEPREPADAVVRAWLGLQETAEQSGVARHAAETPTEFTRRILRRAGADPRPVQTLLGLYLRTRFGEHPVSDADVDAVRAALRALVAAWPPAAAGR